MCWPRPAQTVAVAHGPGSAGLTVRGQRAAEADEWVEDVIASVAKPVERAILLAEAIEHVQARASEIRHDAVPSETQGVDQIGPELGAQAGSETLRDGLFRSGADSSGQAIVVQGIGIGAVVVSLSLIHI